MRPVFPSAKQKWPVQSTTPQTDPESTPLASDCQSKTRSLEYCPQVVGLSLRQLEAATASACIPAKLLDTSALRGSVCRVALVQA